MPCVGATYLDRTSILRTDIMLGLQAVMEGLAEKKRLRAVQIET